MAGNDVQLFPIACWALLHKTFAWGCFPVWVRVANLFGNRKASLIHFWNKTFLNLPLLNSVQFHLYSFFALCSGVSRVVRGAHPHVLAPGASPHACPRGNADIFVFGSALINGSTAHKTFPCTCLLTPSTRQVYQLWWCVLNQLRHLACCLYSCSY